jgi:iron only hydrogenase large subunit-like protein
MGNLNFPLKGKYAAMLAPSFVVDFSYPQIIFQLKELGFDKVVELTFGAKMINRDYHKKLKSSNGLVISSVCPGIVETIKEKFPEYEKNLISVDSPMVAMAKICKKTYPQHKVVFISPCNFKKVEAKQSKIIDAVIDYKELKNILAQNKIGEKKYSKKKILFDKFYNDYTKIYPLSGGLSKTANVDNVLDCNETKIADGIAEVINFLNNPDKKIKFLDVTFCKGGCIGGPCVNSKKPILFRKKKVLKYMKKSLSEDIPEHKKGLVEKAKGISFKSSYPNK